MEMQRVVHHTAEEEEEEVLNKDSATNTSARGVAVSPEGDVHVDQVGRRDAPL